jgi:hypothetical protein
MLRNVINHRSPGSGVYYLPGQRKWYLLRLHICDVVNVFEVRKRVQVFTPLIVTSVKCNLVRKLYANLPDTPVALASASKYFQMLATPLELCKVLSDCARAFSRAPESTCRDGGAFRMLPDFTI